jgi:peptidoglycan/xylan/chitin deacetylase (PgdA/CDA1 family)
MNKFIIRGMSAFVFLCMGHYAFASAQLPPQLVVLQYHHVDNNTPAVTSVSPAKFKEHMQYLSEHHSVMSLQAGLDAIRQNKPLPENAIAITFDDGYRNILENAHPILSEYDFPYTVFINPDSIGSLTNHLTWDEVKQMQPLADFANHTLGHPHLLVREQHESEQAWLDRVMNNILAAEDMLTSRLGYSRKWLAYPYGEFNPTLEKAINQAGFIGFGQQSGVVSDINFSAEGAGDPLPRFPAAGVYANLTTLKTKMAAIAMPVVSRTPSNNLREFGSSLNEITFEIAANKPDIQTSDLACYFKGERIIPNLGNTEGNIKVSIALEHSFKAGRVRINCTAPSIEKRLRYYWYSIPFFTPTETGSFLE